MDRVVKKTWIRNDSAIENYETYSYEPGGKLLNITEYNKRNKPTRKQVYEYNDFCRLNGYAQYERIMGKKLKPMVEWKKIENKSGNIDKVEIIYRYEKKTVLYTYEYQ
ncbi:MAG: hypothetical protein IPO21_02800 [Bacteroidales bacterium]|nr:hypothetical protein [Bacteroidales bacterium]